MITRLTVFGDESGTSLWVGKTTVARGELIFPTALAVFCVSIASPSSSAAMSFSSSSGVEAICRFLGVPKR